MYIEDLYFQHTLLGCLQSKCKVKDTDKFIALGKEILSIAKKIESIENDRKENCCKTSPLAAIKDSVYNVIQTESNCDIDEV